MAASNFHCVRFACCMLCLGLTACGVAPTVRVDAPASQLELTVPEPLLSADQHLVVAGETLYAIAFRQRGDFRELARINGIVAPYTIYPGQRIQLRDVASVHSAATIAPTPVIPVQVVQVPGTITNPNAATAAPAPAPTTTTSQALVDNSQALSSVPLAAVTAPPPAAPVNVVAATATPLPPPIAMTASVSELGSPTPVAAPPLVNAVAASSAASLAAIIDPAAATLTRDGVVWRWPTTGKIIGRFVVGDPIQQGIDLAGVVGQAVLAAADGEVVYSGDGLLGYGELVIVKHSPDYLSAYGHNQRRLAAEGDQVKAGQVIAELGQRGSLSLLHFEIRRQGKPVDPLLYLPPR